MEKSIWRLALYHKRAFGETGLNVSPLGLGTVKLGRNIGVKYPKKFAIPNDKEAIEKATQALMEASAKLMEIAQAKAQAGQAGDEAPEQQAQPQDDVVDAEFEEVKEDDKK